MLAAALLALTVAVPGVASATGGGKNPLSEIPPEFKPAVEAAASELGVSADELTHASRKELRSLVCAELEGKSADEVAAKVQAAIDAAPKKDLKNLSEGQIALIKDQMPRLIKQLKAACDEVESVDETSNEESSDDDDAAASGDDASADESGAAADDTPLPDRVDAGAGGLTDTSSTTVPLIFGGIFAAAFGVFGFAVARMRRSA